MLAAFKLRAVPINVNYRYVEDELRYLLDDADAAAIVFHREFAPTARRGPRRTAAARTLLVGRRRHRSDAPRSPGASTTRPRCAASPARDFEPALGRRPVHPLHGRHHRHAQGRDVAPRGHLLRRARRRRRLGGAPITHARGDRRACARPRGRGAVPRCPFMHGTAHWMALARSTPGGTVVIPPDRHFDAERLLAAHRRASRSTFLVIVGDAFARPLVDALDRLDRRRRPRRCIVVLSGGAILSPAVKRRAASTRLPGHARRRRLRRVRDRRRRARRVDGGGADESPRAALRGQRRDRRCSTTTCGRSPGSAWSAGSRAAATSRSATTRTPRRPRRRSPSIDGVRWSVPGDHAARRGRRHASPCSAAGSVSINTGGEKVYPEEVEARAEGAPACSTRSSSVSPTSAGASGSSRSCSPRRGPRRRSTSCERTPRARSPATRCRGELVLVDTIVRSPSGKPDYRWAKEQALSELA